MLAPIKESSISIGRRGLAHARPNYLRILRDSDKGDQCGCGYPCIVLGWSEYPRISGYCDKGDSVHVLTQYCLGMVRVSWISQYSDKGALHSTAPGWSNTLGVLEWGGGALTLLCTS